MGQHRGTSLPTHHCCRLQTGGGGGRGSGRESPRETLQGKTTVEPLNDGCVLRPRILSFIERLSSLKM